MKRTNSGMCFLCYCKIFKLYLVGRTTRDSCYKKEIILVSTDDIDTIAVCKETIKYLQQIPNTFSSIEKES